MQTAAAASLQCIVLTLLPAFSSDSVFIDLPASWPYLSLPSAFANRPTMDDMLTLDIEPRGVYVAEFFRVVSFFTDGFTVTFTTSCTAVGTIS